MSPQAPRAAVPPRPAAAELPLARPAAKYQLVRPRQEAVAVERIDEPAVPSGQTGVGVNDGRQGLFMVVDQHEATVVPGGEAAFAVRVRNTGSLVERITLGALDLPPEWVLVEPPDLKLDVAGEAIAMVRIRPPRDAGVRPGATVFTMSAWSTTNPNVRCQEPVRLIIAEFSESGFVVDPPTSSGKGRGRATISLTNHGNQPVRGRLVGRVDTARVEFRPSSMDVAPGATAVAEARIVPSNRLISGSPKTHLVMAGLDGAPAIAPITFTFQQQPRLSRLVAKVLTVLAAVVLVAAVLVGRNLWINRDRAVPEVVGKQREEAVQALKSKGFEVAPVDEGGHSEPAGQVLDQDPAPNTKAAKGATVTIGTVEDPCPERGWQYAGPGNAVVDPAAVRGRHRSSGRGSDSSCRLRGDAGPETGHATRPRREVPHRHLDRAGDVQRAVGDRSDPRRRQRRTLGKAPAVRDRPVRLRRRSRWNGDRPIHTCGHVRA